MVNNSFSFLLFFIMCVFSSRPEKPAGLFFYLFTFKSKNALFTFLPFYFFTFKLFQLGNFFFPVREVILDVFLNHNAKLRHPELAVGTYGYIGVFKGTFSFKKIQVSQVFPHTP